ncbi:MAG: N-acetylneuraminate synthase family protein [Alkalispirochaeta sp.]
MDRPVVIAEIGCNHMGDMEIAKKMIRVAANFCEVDAVKFQKRTPKELLTPQEYNSPHPVPENSYGGTYGAHREFLEFNADQHRELKAVTEEEGLVYSTSVWDLTSAQEIVPLQPEFLKIPSASNLDFEMLGYLCDKYRNTIHLSFGMTTHAEEEKIVSFFEQKGRAQDAILYACTSGYPVPVEDIRLLEITRLKETFGNRVKAIGFSGHHKGISMDVAAATLGATYIERHFTLDRTWKGTDHAASLEPDGMRRLARDLHALPLAMQYKDKEILDIEAVQRKKLKRKV